MIKTFSKVLGLALVVGTANAAIILQSDLSGMVVPAAGTTATVIAWSGTGLSSFPGASLTVSNDTQSSGTGNLFTTTATGGQYFAPANNVGNGGLWSTTMTITIGASDISVTSFDMNTASFSGSGALQTTATRSNDYKLTVFNGATNLGAATGTGQTSPASSALASINAAFGSAITLTSGQTYTLVMDVAKTPGSPAGNNTGFSSFTLNGTAVPEPSSTALLGLGGLALLRRRRR